MTSPRSNGTIQQAKSKAGHSASRLIVGRMTLAWRKLEQRCSWALPNLLALLADEPPGKIVNACCRDVAERS